MTDKFVAHLERLFSYYGANVEGKSTPDQLLSGLKAWPRNLNFDQTVLLIQGVVEDLVTLRDKYGKQNILVDERLTRFIVLVTKWKMIEYQVLAWTAIKNANLTVPAGPARTKLEKQIGPFLQGT